MSNFFRVIDLPLDCPTTVVGKMWLPEDVETSASPTFLEDSDFEEQIEDKVVKSGRGRRPQRPTEGVETK